MKSIFDGWTTKTQCFGPARVRSRRGTVCYCAMGAGYQRHRDITGAYATWRETCVRIAPLLLERFPELEEMFPFRQDDPIDQAEAIVIVANDSLRVPAEVFRSLDLESQALEQERNAEHVLEKKE